MREEERAVLESELLSLRHHLHEAEAAIAVRICRNYTNTIYQHFLPAGAAAQWAETSDCDHHPGRFPWPLPLRPLSGLPARAWCLLVKTPDWKICSLSESQNFTWLQCHLHCTITWSYHKNFVEEKCYEFICCFHNSLCSLILAQSCRPIAVPSYIFETWLWCQSPHSCPHSTMYNWPFDFRENKSWEEKAAAASAAWLFFWGSFCPNWKTVDEEKWRDKLITLLTQQVPVTLGKVMRVIS